MPTLGETFSFSKTKYREKLQKKELSHIELAKEIYRKRCKILSGKISTGASVAAAVFTGGHSLVASAYSGRNVSVESRKLKILEEEWARRGHDPIPPNTLRDKIIPITVAVGASMFTFTFDVALAMASPDQFYQFTPDPQLNEFLIGSVYYPVVENGVKALGNKVAQVTVSRAPQQAHEADRRDSLRIESKKAYDRDEKYADEESDVEDGWGEAFDSDSDYKSSRRRQV